MSHSERVDEPILVKIHCRKNVRIYFFRNNIRECILFLFSYVKDIKI